MTESIIGVGLTRDSCYSTPCRDRTRDETVQRIIGISDSCRIWISSCREITIGVIGEDDGGRVWIGDLGSVTESVIVSP